MSHRIARVAPLQAAKVFGLVYVFLGLVAMPFFLLPTLLSDRGNAVSLVFSLAVPLLYGMVGFVGTGLFCWVYNKVAARTGGVEVDLSEGSAS